MPTLERIGVVKGALFLGVFQAFVGFLAFLFLSLFIILALVGIGGDDTETSSGILSMGFLSMGILFLALPIGGFISGFISGIIFLPLGNVVLSWIGGIPLDFSGGSFLNSSEYMSSGPIASPVLPMPSS